jgi:phosphohistidine phosphatase
MKKLHIFRHAKSSWSDPLLSDEQRPLKKRGRSDVVLMGLAGKAAGWNRQDVYSSSAVRAQQTIAGLLDALEEDDSAVHYTDDLYTFDYRQLVNWLSARNEDELTLVGHNPALLELIEWLTGEPLQKFPTCAYCQLELDLGNWNEFSHGKGKITKLLFPKMLKNA